MRNILILINILLVISFTNAQTKSPILRMNSETHLDYIEKVCTDKEGKYILSVSRDKNAILWDTSLNFIRKFNIPIDEGAEGKLYACALTPDGRYALIGGYTGYSWDKKMSVYIYNTKTGEMNKRITDLPHIIFDIKFSTQNSYFGIALGGNNGVWVYKYNISPNGDFNYEKHAKLIGFEKDCKSISFGNENDIAAISGNGTIKLFDNNFNLINEINMKEKIPNKVVFSPNYKFIAVSYFNSQDIDVFTSNKLKSLNTFTLERHTNVGTYNTGLTFSEDSKRLFAGAITVKKYTVNEFSIIREWNIDNDENAFIDYPAAQNSISNLIALNNGKILYADVNVLGIYNIYTTVNKRVFDNINKFATIEVKDRQFNHFKISENADIVSFYPYNIGKQIDFSISKRNYISSKNTTSLFQNRSNKIVITDWHDNLHPKINGKNVSILKKNERCFATDISSNGEKIIFGAEYGIYCTDKIGNKLWYASNPSTYAINISGNDEFVVAVSHDGLISWYRMNDGKHLFSLYTLPNLTDWIVFTQEGYFDCSFGGQNYMGWHINEGAEKAAKFYPLSQFFEKYYIPNLGSRLLSGEDITKDDLSLNFNLPPLVEITSPQDQVKLSSNQLTVNVKVTDQGGGIDEIRLYMNGKQIETTQRGFIKVEQKGNEKIKTFTITLINGENKITATAFNNQRTESIPDEITVFYEGIKKTANLYVLVVGINNYKNPKYKLNYAVDDATGFKEEIEKGSKDIFGSVNITYLKDEQANRESIMQEFKKLKTNAKQEDVFIFYYAGHGVMSEDEKAQFHIVPYDVTQLYGDNELLKTKAISANELQQFATDLKAQKQMFVLDACQSGGMTELLASRGAAEEKAIAQLARSTGTYWLTASNSEQFATEFKQIGHGVFTYAVLLGLKGEADGGSKDKKITVKELSAFLNDKVPELSEKYKGEAQWPTSYGYGQDFPIIIVK